MISQEPRPNHWADVVCLAALLLMVLWFGQEMWITGKVPFFRDLGPYFYPMRWSLAESLRNGELPLWDRHAAAGFPLLANLQSGVFYLPHLSYLLLPFFSAVSVTFLFHYLVAAAGTYFLCRHWQYPPYLSVIGAVLFTFGGMIVSLSNLLNHFQAAVWLPLAVLWAEKYLASPRARNFFAFAAILLLQLLSGSPEIYLMTVALVLLAALRVKAIGPETCPFKNIALLLLGGNALVAALGMVQLAPTAELFLQSRRSQPLPFSEALDWSLSPSNLFNLFFLDKEVDLSVLPGMRLFFMTRASFLVSYYLGAISLFGACLWMLCGSTKERAVGLALVASTLVLALGASTPVYPLLLHYFPVLGLMRFPEKYFFLTHGIIWFVVVRGLFLFMEGDTAKQRRSFVGLVSLVFILLLFYVFLRSNTGLLSQFIATSSRSLSGSLPPIATAASVLVSVERQLILSSGLLLLLFGAKKKLTRIALLQGLLVASVFVDLATAHREYQFLLRPDFLQESSGVTPLPKDEIGRLFYYPAEDTLHPAQYTVLGQPTFDEAISMVFGNRLPNTGILNQVDYLQEIDTFSREPYLRFLNFADRADRETQFRLLAAFNVRHLISFRPLLGRNISLVRHFPEYPSWLYEIDQTIPRTYVVSQSVVEADPQKVFERLGSYDFDPRQTVILDRHPGILSRQSLIATTKIARYHHQSVTIDATLNDSGILVLADAYYPGWNVYVNGEGAPILRANHFFRAVALAPGEHRVEFRYEPVAFKIGLIISLITVFSMTFYCALALRPRPKLTREQAH